jgi:hypothetical protein
MSPKGGGATLFTEMCRKIGSPAASYVMHIAKNGHSEGHKIMEAAWASVTHIKRSQHNGSNIRSCGYWRHVTLLDKMIQIERENSVIVDGRRVWKNAGVKVNTTGNREIEDYADARGVITVEEALFQMRSQGGKFYTGLKLNLLMPSLCTIFAHFSLQCF